jgi:type IV pilus assembly protein PilB
VLLILCSDSEQDEETAPARADKATLHLDPCLTNPLHNGAHPLILPQLTDPGRGADISPTVEAARYPWPALGALLARDGLIDRDELEAVLAAQAETGHPEISGKRLGEALVDRGLVTSAQVAQLVAEQYELPFVDLDEREVNLNAAALLSAELARRFSALPISVLPDESLLVAVSDPTNVLRSDELRRTLGRPLRYAVAAPDALEFAIAFAEERARTQVEHADRESAPDDGLLAEVHTIQIDPAPPAEINDPPARRAPAGVAYPPALGTLLVRDGLIREDELDAALAQQRLTRNKRLGEILVERGIVSRTQVARLIAEQYELPFIELVESDVELKAAALLPAEMARRYSALPVAFSSDDAITVAVADPTDTLYADDLQSALGVPIRFVVAAPSVIESAITLVHGESAQGEAAAGVGRTSDESSDVEFGVEDPLAERVDETPVELPSIVGEDLVGPNVSETDEVDAAIEQALSLGASDIHFTPQSHAVVVRARIEGVMRELGTIPSSNQAAVATRLKVLGQLDTEEWRAPQDGRLSVRTGDESFDLRIVVLPPTHGEKVTLHLLHQASTPVSLTDLGMAPDAEEELRQTLLRPSGLVLACGPVGSGTTTTLYAALQELNVPERTLATIEDPVEHVAPGIDQTEIDPVAGLTYASGLHAVLRSDPDVVLVGEIRDGETAHVAVRAALTGRLVLSALHVHNSVAAVERLLEMGVDPALLGGALAGVVGQRLARGICTDCRQSYYATPEDIRALGLPSEENGRRLLARGAGCTACGGSGYRGRVALFELLSLTDDVRELVARRASMTEIQHAAIVSGMRTLRDEGIRLCLEGVTTTEEVRRVAGA